MFTDCTIQYNSSLSKQLSLHFKATNLATTTWSYYRIIWLIFNHVYIHCIRKSVSKCICTEKLLKEKKNQMVNFWRNSQNCNCHCKEAFTSYRQPDIFTAWKCIQLTVGNAMNMHDAGPCWQIVETVGRAWGKFILLPWSCEENLMG